MNELFKQYKQNLARIAEDEANGTLNANQAQFSRNQLDEEYEAALAEFEAGAKEEVAEFAAGNSLGATLLEIAERSGYEDAEEFLIDLSDELDIEPEDAYALIVSEEEFDDELVDDVLGTLLGDEDEIDEEFDTEDEYEDDEEYDEEDEIEYDDEASYSNSELDELREEMAEFKLEKELKVGLSQLRNKALDLLDDGRMSSFGYSLLFPDTDNDDELLACFSSVVEKNGTNIETELIRVQGVLEWCEKAHDSNMFADVIAEEQQARFSQQDLDPEEDAEIQATAIHLYKNLI